MICQPCCDQRCEECVSPLGCGCQHRAAKTHVEWLDTDARHAVAMGHEPGERRDASGQPST